MSRFNPIKPKLAIVPVKNDAGRVVDAAIVATVDAPGESQPPARNVPGCPQGPVTLTFNAAKNGLQLHFPSKPSEEIRAELKAAGWRWSFRHHCWYHRDTPANQDFAERFVTRLNCTETQSESKIEAPVAPVNIVPLPALPGRGSVPGNGVPAWRLRLAATPKD